MAASDSSADGLPPLPLPPSDCSDLDIRIVQSSQLGPEFAPGQAWFRCGRPPLNSGILHAGPKYRFDCPVRLDGSARYVVWYGAQTILGALCEVYGEGRSFVTLPEREGRGVGAVGWRRELGLVDLRAPAVLGLDLRRNPGLDNRISSDGDYRLTRAWSDTIRRCNSEVDGLVYFGRKAGETCLALFHDRCAPDLVELGAPTSLDDPSLDEQWSTFERLIGIRRAY